MTYFVQEKYHTKRFYDLPIRLHKPAYAYAKMAGVSVKDLEESTLITYTDAGRVRKMVSVIG